MKLLKLTIILTISFVSVFTQAQDVIVKKNGREYSVTILKMDEALIRFQKYGGRDNRVFIIPLKRLIGIKFQDGKIMWPDGSNLDEKEFEYRKLFFISNKELKTGIARTSIGCTLFIGGSALAGQGIFMIDRNSQQDEIWGSMALLAGSFIAIGGIPLTAIGAIQIRKAKNGLRKAEELRPTLSFNPVIAPNINAYGQVSNFRAGVGMTLSF